MIEVHLTAKAIPAEDLGRSSQSPLAVFEAQSLERVKSSDPSIQTVSFDAFPAMTLEVFRKVCDEAVQQWGQDLDISLWHRTGPLEVGNLFLFLKVMGPERSALHEASIYILDEIKKRAPIWKKEVTSIKMSEPLLTSVPWIHQF